MTEYKLRSKTLTTKTKRNREQYTTEIPDDAVGVDVEYEEPVGMGKPSLKAHIRYLEPVGDDSD